MSVASAGALLLAGCVEPRFPSGQFAFSCAGDGRCPEGYYCSADLCLREGEAPLPPVLDRSAAPFRIKAYPDRDRNGVVFCWTRREDRDSQRGELQAAFMGADGTVRGPVTLAVFNSLAAETAAMCTPVPNSGGRLLVTVATNRATVERTELGVWAPTSTNGTEGPPISSLLFTESSEYRNGFERDFIEPDLAGDEVWVPVRHMNAQPDSTNAETRVVRLRVRAGELDTMRVRRDVLYEGLYAPTYGGLGFRCSNGMAPCWLYMNALNGTFGLVENEPTMENPTVLFQPTPSQRELGYPIGSNPTEHASLWQDPAETGGELVSFRIGWVRPRTSSIVCGPRLPFARFDTQFPGTFADATHVYVIGARAGDDLPPRDLNPCRAPMRMAGMPVVNPVERGTGPASRLRVYRVGWSATAGSRWEQVAEIPRDRLGNRPVVSAAGLPVSAGGPIALAWLEYVPAEQLGTRSTRYELYFQLVRR